LLQLDRGVAIAIASPELVALHQHLAYEWQSWLTPQDRQRFQAHVTIQNKAAVNEARDLHRELKAGFRPLSMRGEGLQLWRYLGGPWESVRRFRFTG
jgi:2'-5' RNA ligase